MRTVQASLITQTIRDLIYEASYVIGNDVVETICAFKAKEPSPSGRAVLDQLLENYEIAKTQRVAICQDTGMCIVFMDIGQDVHIEGEALYEAVSQGVREAYAQGYLRKSVVRDPLYDRTNTRDNTPPILHTRIVPGDKIDILVSPKGFGSENMSAIAMLVPADGEAGVIDFVVKTAVNAGSNPCPPIIVGVGIGGTMELATLMAKRMTARALDVPNKDPRYQALEEKILEKINRSGIGPAGIGGRTTALKVNIDVAPTHIAGMPVAVNICCHAARHAHAII